MNSDFKPTRLYVKKHIPSGILYFGKTVSEDPYLYPGSGVDWSELIQEGDVKTLWVSDWYYDKDEIVEVSLMFSYYHNIIEDDLWCNKSFENGLDGYTSNRVDLVGNNCKKSYSKPVSQSKGSKYCCRKCCDTHHEKRWLQSYNQKKVWENRSEKEKETIGSKIKTTVVKTIQNYSEEKLQEMKKNKSKGLKESWKKQTKEQIENRVREIKKSRGY